MAVSEQDRLSLSFAETFQDHAKPHAIFSQFRREEPVAWCPEPWGGPGFWSITKYDDIQEISKLAYMVNEATENIGARRLHTIMEALLEDVSFSAMEMRNKRVTIDSRYVQKQLADIVRDKDMSRYIL